MLNQGIIKDLKDSKKRNLLINSESIKGFDNLYRFLAENEEITEELIDRKFTDQEKTEINDMLPRIISSCKDEWVGDETLLYPVEVLEGENRIPCSLCSTKNKLIFYITNKISKKKMNVGSTCIEEFSVENLQDGKTKSELEKQARRNLKLKELNRSFPSIAITVENWSDVLDTFDILIPNKIEKPYLELGQKLRTIYDDFLNEKSNESIFDEITIILNKQKEYLDEMNVYNGQNLNNKFVVKKSIVDWLRRYDKYSIIEKLKENGYITLETAPKIHEDIFLSTMVNEFSQHLSDLGVRIIDVDHDIQSFIIKPFEHLDIKLKCKYQKFIEYFGWMIFSEKKFAVLSLINIFRVSRMYDRRTRELLISELSKKLNTTKSVIRIHIDHYDEQYDPMEVNELDLLDTRINKVYVVQLDEFIEEYKHVGFNIGKDKASEIINHVDRLAKVQKQFTKHELREIRLSSRKDIRDNLNREIKY